jgi:hypothetical protein
MSSLLEMRISATTMHPTVVRVVIAGRLAEVQEAVNGAGVQRTLEQATGINAAHMRTAVRQAGRVGLAVWRAVEVVEHSTQDSTKENVVTFGGRLTR